jgi:hypothetical protein
MSSVRGSRAPCAPRARSCLLRAASSRTGVGEHVLVEWEEGKFYPAYVVESHGTTRYRVHFDGYDRTGTRTSASIASAAASRSAASATPRRRSERAAAHHRQRGPASAQIPFARAIACASPGAAALPAVVLRGPPARTRARPLRRARERVGRTIPSTRVNAGSERARGPHVAAPALSPGMRPRLRHGCEQLAALRASNEARVRRVGVRRRKASAAARRTLPSRARRARGRAHRRPGAGTRKLRASAPPTAAARPRGAPAVERFRPARRPRPTSRLRQPKRPLKLPVFGTRRVGRPRVALAAKTAAAVIC